MKSIILLAVAILMLSLSSGCSALKSPARWVDNNTFYSDKLPAIEIKVADSIDYINSKPLPYKGESIFGNVYANVDSEWFYFSGSGQRNLRINIETLARDARIYMGARDWSKHPGALASGSKTMGGIVFSTGIIKDKANNYPALIKAYSAKVDDSIRYKIIYYETVDSSWLSKSASLLTSEDRDFLAAFDKRADGSFVVAPYSGKQPPTQ